MVKKILSVFALGLLAVGAQAQLQLQNAGFDSWESVTYSGKTGDEPIGWSSFLDGTGSLKNQAGAVQLYKDTDRQGKSGSYSAKLTSRSVVGVVAQGNLTTGCVNMGSMTASDASGNYNYVDGTHKGQPFTGHPDAVRVWVKYNSSAGTLGQARFLLVTEGYYQDPASSKNPNTATLVAVASNTAVANASGWQELVIPFKWEETGVEPQYAFVNIATCNSPGTGNVNDVMWVDDIEMIYYSHLTSATYAGNNLTFNASNHAAYSGAYNKKLLKLATGAGATMTTTFNETTFLLTIHITGEDSVNGSNEHTYTIQFSGMASEKDDEAEKPISGEKPTVETSFSSTGTYYLYNMKYGAYLAHGNTLTDTPEQKWTFSSNGISDEDGCSLKLALTGSYEKKSEVDYSIFTVYTNGSGDISVAKSAYSNGKLRMYVNTDAYQTFTGIGSLGWWTTKKADIYVGADGKTTLAACNNTDEKGQWELHNVASVERIRSYASVTSSSPVNVTSAFVKNGATTSDLPRGIYQITGSGSLTFVEDGKTMTYSAASGKFYIPYNTAVTFSGTPTLTYYGALDLSLHATYDGSAVQSGGQVNDVYFAELLQTTLGNGAQTVSKNFDQETCELTVIVSGYGRQVEHMLKFKAPDLGLHATWYGEVVEDGQKISEEYRADKLIITPGRGASEARVANHNTATGEVTIEVTSYGQTATYTLQFQTAVEAEGDELVFNTARLFTQKLNGASYTATTPTIRIQPLVDGHINFTLTGTPSGIGTVVAKHIATDRHGNFQFASEVRVGEQLVPFVVNGTLQGNQLQAVATVSIPQAGNQYRSYHVTYNLSAVQSRQTFTHDLVVTVNGEQSTAKNQQVQVEYLADGNINFSLQNFTLSLGGEGSDPDCVGDIFMENLKMDQEGHFSYESGILIGASSGVENCLGPTLGVVPVSVHGEIFGEGASKDMIMTIDITMESIQQTISVYFGAPPVSTVTYTDLLVVTINGDSTPIPNTQVEVENLANGNINFNLKNFMMPLGGTAAYVGNVRITNLEVDANGDFEYNGVIRIGNGDLPGVDVWMGNELGDVPLRLRGQIYGDYGFGLHNPTGTDGATCLMAVIDIRMESIGETIHVTYGLGEDKQLGAVPFEDVLSVTINGAVNTQEGTKVDLVLLNNAKINFTLNDFVLVTEENGQTMEMPIGNISFDALTIDAQNRFHYEGTIRIAVGTTEGVAWSGPNLGDVPLTLNGKLVVNEETGDQFLVVGIDIDMEESLGQTINVTFGGQTSKTRQFVDRLDVAVNGEVNTKEQAVVEVGYLAHDEQYINFNLKNFVMDIDGEPMYLGNIAINTLELDADGCFTYNGRIRIGNGDMVLPQGAEWAGDGLGAIPLDMKGQIYTYQGVEYLSASINIDMEESIQQTITVAFGAVPVDTEDYIGTLLVSINKQNYSQPRTDIEVGLLRNGNINFNLKNFKLSIEGSDAYVGNIQLQNMSLDAEGNFQYLGNVRIGEGDQPGVQDWMASHLGVVPLDLQGTLRDRQLTVSISIDMRDTALKQLIEVRFGYSLDGQQDPVKCYNLNKRAVNGEKIEVADLSNVIQSILEQGTRFDAQDVEKAVDIILQR